MKRDQAAKQKAAEEKAAKKQQRADKTRKTKEAREALKKQRAAAKAEKKNRPWPKSKRLETRRFELTYCLESGTQLEQEWNTTGTQPLRSGTHLISSL